MEPFADAAGKPRVSPVEVKSGRQRSYASLEKFRRKFGKAVGTEYVLYPGNVAVDGRRVSLPLCMGFCL